MTDSSPFYSFPRSKWRFFFNPFNRLAKHCNLIRSQFFRYITNNTCLSNYLHTGNDEAPQLSLLNNQKLMLFWNDRASQQCVHVAARRCEPVGSSYQRRMAAAPSSRRRPRDVSVPMEQQPLQLFLLHTKLKSIKIGISYARAHVLEQGPFFFYLSCVTEI